MKPSHTRAKEPGIIGLGFWLYLRWMGWCFIGWLCALLMTIISLAWLGQVAGLEFFQQQLLKQFIICQAEASHFIVLKEPLNLVTRLVDQLIKIEHYQPRSLATLAPIQFSMGHMLQQTLLKTKLLQFSATLKMGWQALLVTTAMALLRLILALHEIGLFFILGFIGFIDGLVLRDLRRFGGGRESALIYHRAKKCLSSLICGACFFYFIIPWAIPPEWLFVPFSVFFGLATAFTAKTFKKYL